MTDGRDRRDVAVTPCSRRINTDSNTFVKLTSRGLYLVLRTCLQDKSGVAEVSEQISSVEVINNV